MGEGLRQVQGKSGALANGTLNADLPTQQAGDFSADRQAQAGATVFAVGTHFSLLERLEDDRQHLRRDADSGVTNRELDDSLRAVERAQVRTPAAGGRVDPQLYPS